MRTGLQWTNGANGTLSMKRTLAEEEHDLTDEVVK